MSVTEKQSISAEGTGFSTAFSEYLHKHDFKVCSDYIEPRKKNARRCFKHAVLPLSFLVSDNGDGTFFTTLKFENSELCGLRMSADGFCRAIDDLLEWKLTTSITAIQNTSLKALRKSVRL